MKKLVFICLLAMGIGFVNPAFAQAEEMHCLVGVLKGADIEHEDQATDSGVLVSLPIVDGAGDKEFTVGGETVSFSVYKYEYTDLYNATFLLLTPASEIPARGPNFVAIISDYLVNAGPTKENGWTIKPGPNSTKFEYLNRQSGSVAITRKFKKVLEDEGKWGQYPFNSMQMDVQQSYYLAEEARELFKAGKIAATDVLAIYTAFSCTLTK